MGGLLRTRGMWMPVLGNSSADPNYLDPGSTKCQCKYRRLQLYYVRKRWLNLLDPAVAVVIIRKEDRWFNRKIPRQIDQTQRAPSGLRVAIGHHNTVNR